MKLEAILFANAAMVNEHSLLMVDGAGWRFVERDFFPATIGGSVCGIVMIEVGDFGSVFTLSMEIADDSGHVERSSGSMILDVREDSEAISTSRLPFAFPFVTVAQEPTILKAIVKSNGEELGSLDVVVRWTQHQNGQ